MNTYQLALLVDGVQTAEENLRRLTTANIPVRHPRAWTYSEMIDVLGAKAVTELIVFVQSAAAANPMLGPAHLALAVGGLDLSTDKVQAQINALLPLLSEQQKPLLEAVKQLGVTWQTPLGDDTVTLDEVAMALAYRAKRAELDALQDSVLQAKDAAIAMLDAAKTVEEVFAVVAPKIG